jgi:hypothetical protein
MLFGNYSKIKTHLTLLKETDEEISSVLELMCIFCNHLTSMEIWGWGWGIYFAEAAERIPINQRLPQLFFQSCPPASLHFPSHYLANLLTRLFAVITCASDKSLGLVERSQKGNIAVGQD